MEQAPEQETIEAEVLETEGDAEVDLEPIASLLGQMEEEREHRKELEKSIQQLKAISKQILSNQAGF